MTEKDELREELKRLQEEFKKITEGLEHRRDKYYELVKKFEDAKRETTIEANIAVLNEAQVSGLVHPYTCLHNGDHILIATRRGWVCPHCTYEQPFSKTD